MHENGSVKTFIIHLSNNQNKRIVSGETGTKKKRLNIRQKQNSGSALSTEWLVEHIVSHKTREACGAKEPWDRGRGNGRTKSVVEAYPN